MASNLWIWSEPHQDYYYVTHDTYGRPVYTWAKQSSTQPAPQSFAPVVPHVRVDSASVDAAVPPIPVPFEVRQSTPNFIAGNPQEGWYDRLDPSYRMRTGSEARQFFKLGRVFAMLYTEQATGAAKLGDHDECFTLVKYGEQVYSQIRRFVVVSVRRNFVHACAISTYGKQGTLKRGRDPGEHAVIYNTGVDPGRCYLAGEREQGLYKDPIQVTPVDASSYLSLESRIRFGKVYSIEWNVKVKDIGRVVPEDLSVLAAHYAEENDRWDTAA